MYTRPYVYMGTVNLRGLLAGAVLSGTSSFFSFSASFLLSQTWPPQSLGYGDVDLSKKMTSPKNDDENTQKIKTT